MFGFHYFKAEPTQYVIHSRAGKTIREGVGLSFFHYTPTSNISVVPVHNISVPFIFRERTGDFQEVTVQGQLTYRISDPSRIANLLNFAFDVHLGAYLSEDPKNLPQRLVDNLQVILRTHTRDQDLRTVLGIPKPRVTAIRDELQETHYLKELGLKIQDLTLTAVKPNPETSKALEAKVREQFLREADEAVYDRRNAAVEAERAIRENELETEHAVEQKKRTIMEAKMDAERAVQQKQQNMDREQMLADVQLEEERRSLVALTVENTRAEADGKAYELRVVMEPMASLDPKVIQALASIHMKPEQLIAGAFQDLAGNAGKIGELNVSPDLLKSLMRGGGGGGRHARR